MSKSTKFGKYTVTKSLFGVSIDDGDLFQVDVRFYSSANEIEVMAIFVCDEGMSSGKQTITINHDDTDLQNVMDGVEKLIGSFMMVDEEEVMVIINDYIEGML